MLGIGQGDRVRLSTELGSIELHARLTRSIQRGMAAMLPDYREADICSILPADCVDPCSGIPALRTMSCAIAKAD